MCSEKLLNNRQSSVHGCAADDVHLSQNRRALPSIFRPAAQCLHVCLSSCSPSLFTLPPLSCLSFLSHLSLRLTSAVFFSFFNSCFSVFQTFHFYLRVCIKWIYGDTPLHPDKRCSVSTLSSSKMLRCYANCYKSFGRGRLVRHQRNYSRRQKQRKRVKCEKTCCNQIHLDDSTQFIASKYVCFFFLASPDWGFHIQTLFTPVIWLLIFFSLLWTLVPV